MGRGREQKSKQIEDLLNEWRRMLEERGKSQLFDLHHESETSSANIFNAVFGWKLVNENENKIGTAIIDLKDKKNKLYVQVSSDGSTHKVRKTVEKFSESVLAKSGYRLMVFALGKKSSRLPEEIVINGFTFIPEDDVFDFNDLTRGFRYFQMDRMDALYKLVHREIRPEISSTAPVKADDGRRLKRNLTLRDKLAKQLLKPARVDDPITYIFEPHWKFKYSDVIIREHKDKTFPNGTDAGSSFSWCTLYLFNQYDRGLEFIDGIGGRVAINAKGEWFKLEFKDELPNGNHGYEVLSVTNFYRIAYDDIVLFDTEADDYYDLPTLYVRSAHAGKPWETILFGTQGNLDKRRLVNYLNLENEIDPPASY